MIQITFYYFTDATITRAVGGQPAAGVERHGETVTVRGEPIARVALPLTVALDMLASIVENVADGIPFLQQSMEQFGTRTTA
ncbi:MAG TPA: hypothetical protein VFB99_08515 [Vicinamibacterales bacterium]|nr:hypothetical protein [Vicinamibacterales bacterium]